MGKSDQTVKKESEPDLKDVCHYVDAQRMDHQHLSCMGRQQQIANLRGKLLHLPQKEFDHAMRTISKLVEKTPTEKKNRESLDPVDGVSLYDEVRPSGGDAAVDGVPTI